jgi:collagen beta-1,O-galactosyltransferase
VIIAPDIRTYIVSLRRREDRRQLIKAALPAALHPYFTSDWPGETDPFDGHHLSLEQLRADGVGLFDWPIKSDNPWWNRPLKYGEIGCALAHLACWRHAASTGIENYTLILEDDAVLPADFLPRLLDILCDLDSRKVPFDLLYLGRYPLESDVPIATGIVRPGYSHCSYAYLLARRTLAPLLDSALDQAIVPVDEFLPALYINHPRADLRQRYPRSLTALALDPPLVMQRPKEEAGSDTEDSAFIPCRP